MTDVWCGGRRVADAGDLVRRYCGLPWSGGSHETWAWRYFDELPDLEPDVVSPVDVLAAGSLHSGLSRADLSFFVDAAEMLTGWLSTVSQHTDLATADPNLIDVVCEMPRLADGVTLSLLSKVLHRKRPGLVPMFDRALQEQYRVPGGPRGVAMWHDLVTAIRSDLRDDANMAAIATIGYDLAAAHLLTPPTGLRILDIVIWMSSQRL